MPEPCPIQQIEHKLADSIAWNRARIKFLARFLVALIACRSVCLTHLANAFPGKAQTGAHYKRLQRFLRHFEMDFGDFARLILAVVGAKPPFVLAMDRTNWKFGKAEINVLMLAVVKDGIAFPVLWSVLGKAGNSNTKERQKLMARFLDRFGAARVAYLCADREFVGKAWFAWLLAQGVSFRIRVRNNTQIANACGAERCARGLFWHRKTGAAHALGQRRVWGKSLFVAGVRLPQGEFVIVVSDQESTSLLEDYGKRWGIETLFGCLKRRGFCLEATHLREPQRLEKLLALLALAFCWAYVTGEWLFCCQPWTIRSHGRLPVSLFRRGLDWLQRLLLPLSGAARPAEVAQAVHFLSCT